MILVLGSTHRGQTRHLFFAVQQTVRRVLRVGPSRSFRSFQNWKIS